MTGLQGILIDLNFLERPFEALQEIEIKKRIMPDGMIFVICKNELVGEVIGHFEAQDFKYAENMVIVPILKEICRCKRDHLTKAKAKVPINPVSNSISIDEALRSNGDNQFCNSVSETMVMMRRWGPGMKTSLVIQHQRTCDTCFYIDGNRNSLTIDGAYPWK